MKLPSRWARPFLVTCLLLNTALLLSCSDKQEQDTSPVEKPPETDAKNNLNQAAEQATSAPGVPGGITATASDGTIKISWDMVPMALQYNIYIAGEPGVQPNNYWKLNKGSTYITTELSYTNTELENGTTYYFVVTAVNNKGESPSSTQITATPKPITPTTLESSKPNAPSGLVATAQNKQVTLSWEDVEGAGQYNVYMATEFGVNPHLYNKLQNGIAVLNVSNPYTHQGLTNNTVYYFVVTAKNNAGESNASPETYATPLKPQPLPSTLARLKATASDGKVTLQWQQSEHANHYNVYMATKAGIDTTNITERPGYSVSQQVHSPFVQRELVNGQNYYFVVTAENEGGESPASQELKLSPGVKVEAPKPPAKVLIAEIDKKIVISWSDAPGAKYYNVYMASQSGVGAKNYSRLENGTARLKVNSPLQLDELPQNKSFYFIVSAVNKAGESQASKAVTIKTAPGPVSEAKPVSPRRSAKYVTLDSRGKVLKNQDTPYSRRPWACVRSNATGLVWEVKTNEPGLHHKNNAYTWFNPDKTVNSNVAGTQKGGVCVGSQCDTAAFIETVNAARLCGFNDWRLPTRKELSSLIETNVIYPDATIDNESFPNTAKSFHWSNTSYSHNPELAWFVYFGSGYEYYEYKSFASHVRLVRGKAAVANVAPNGKTEPKPALKSELKPELKPN